MRFFKLRVGTTNSGYHVIKKMADREPPPIDDENSKDEDDLFADADDVNIQLISPFYIVVHERSE